MKIPPLQNLPIVAAWLLQRRLKFLFWGLANRMVPGRFRSIGLGVKFNGWVRFEKPCMDIRVGDRCSIGRGCYFLATSQGQIKIAEDVGINDNCFITSNFGINIGAKTWIAEFVSIRDYDHEFSRTDIPIRDQGFRGGPIKIGDDCWIGRGVMITGNVTIGSGSVIGANSVVTRSIPEMSVAVGAPARVIRMRKPAAD